MEKYNRDFELLKKWCSDCKHKDVGCLCDPCHDCFYEDYLLRSYVPKYYEQEK